MGSVLRLMIAVLLARCWLTNGDGLESRCAEKYSQDSKVCCKKCSPGHRLLSRCGEDLEGLCVPCETGTYLDEAGYTCKLCKDCTDPHVLKESCTSSRDAVCGCKAGNRCGDAECSFCIEECGKGFEPKDPFSCRRCPDGTFNDKIHEKCVPWSTSCPQPDQQIAANGTAETDIVCSSVSKKVQRNFPSAEDTASHGMMVVAIAVACFCLGLLPTCFLMGKMYMKKKTATLTPEKRQTEGSSKAMHPQNCQFGQPEQEQGGSMGSISSDESQKTLLSV